MGWCCEVTTFFFVVDAGRIPRLCLDVGSILYLGVDAESTPRIALLTWKYCSGAVGVSKVWGPFPSARLD